MSTGSQSPGHLVRQYASRYNWPIAEYSILVEGETDARYLSLASRLHRDDTGCDLMPRGKVSAFPTGSGDDGGTHGILRHFSTLQDIIAWSGDEDGRVMFKLIALVDGDSAGKAAFRALAAKSMDYRPWREIFLLQRNIPRGNMDPEFVGRLVARENEDIRLDCEIEDLVSQDLVRAYLADNPRALRCAPVFRGEHMRVQFADGEKGKFCRFVESYATCSDLAKIIELLKTLRFFMGLPPDG